MHKKHQIVIPEGTRQVLLHTCCAPCSSAIIEWMMNNGLKPTIYFCNPNIFPQKEYDIRKEELIRYAQAFDLQVVDADYDHASWLEYVKGLEDEPERGARCLMCFKYRLLSAARYAHEHGFDVLTTTLASSRWKSLDQVAEAGSFATSFFPDVFFWAQNWRVCGLSDRRSAIIKEQCFYNQQYCGCEFSLRQTIAFRKARMEQESAQENSTHSLKDLLDLRFDLKD